MKHAYTCIIVDDEPPAVRLIEKYIEKVPFLKLVRSFTSPLEALKEIEIHPVDLLFLDIQMPEISGIQLSKIIDKEVHIIFTTAYPDFALESYEVAALDYLLKPIEFDRFYQAVKKINSQKMMVGSRQDQSHDFLFIKLEGKKKYAKVFIKDILYIEGLRNYVRIRLADRDLVTYNSLKKIREILPDEDFIQIHKSYIVSIQKITTIDHDAVWIGTKQLSIGNTFQEAFFKMVNDRKSS